MVNWFRRARERIDVPRLTPRSEQRAVERVDLADLTPSLPVFLAASAHIQLAFFESLAAVVAATDDLRAKSELAPVAARTLEKYERLSAELARSSKDPLALMRDFTPRVRAFQRSIESTDWFEMLVASHITAGFLDDYFVRLGGGFESEAGERAVAIIRTDPGHDRLVAVIDRGIDADPLLGSRLAMWGRRLVGDTMLLARSVLSHSAEPDRDEARLEPVFTELIAEHTRRMDGLGLTA